MTDRGAGRLTILLRGGFANQLFQWGSARWLQQSTGCEVTWDTRFVQRPFERGDQLTPFGLISDRLEDGPAARAFWRWSSMVLPVAMHVRLAQGRPARRGQRLVSTVDEALPALQAGDDVVLWGYSQEVSRLGEIRTELSGIVEAHARRYLPDGLKAQSYSALHVRRGDYVSNDDISRRFGPTQSDYFLSAASRLGRPLLIVSDDQEWCREHLLPAIPDSRVMQTDSLFADFAILVLADQLSLSNSTFSWWGGFCGEHSLVVAPSPWLDDPTEPDLALDNWLRLDKRTGSEISIPPSD